MPLIPLPVPVHNKTKMKTLQELALKAVPKPGGQAREFLPSSHTVRIALDNREYDEMHEKYKEEHKLRFRYVCDQLLVLEKLNCTLPLVPSRVMVSTLRATFDLCLERRWDTWHWARFRALACSYILWICQSAPAVLNTKEIKSLIDFQEFPSLKTWFLIVIHSTSFCEGSLLVTKYYQAVSGKVPNSKIAAKPRLGIIKLDLVKRLCFQFIMVPHCLNLQQKYKLCKRLTEWRTLKLLNYRELTACL